MVVGAGVMGHSIAQVFSHSGIEVGLVDLNDQALEHAMELIRANLETLAEYGSITADEISTITSRIHPVTELSTAADGCDFVLEAVAEVPDVKKKIFAQLNECCPKDTVLASNTSGLDVFGIVEIDNPERLVITHWFAPPHIIPLVEVVPGPQTSVQVVTFAAELMKSLGKEPIIMKQFVPSFIVNRIQNMIGMTVMEIINNGWAAPEDIDKAVKYTLGIRLPIIGVVQTLDFTGLNLVYDVMKNLGLSNALIEEKVNSNQLGVKSSKGIYDYNGRSEEEILKKRDLMFLKTIDHLQNIKGFEPV